MAAGLVGWFNFPMLKGRMFGLTLGGKLNDWLLLPFHELMSLSGHCTTLMTLSQSKGDNYLLYPSTIVQAYLWKKESSSWNTTESKKMQLKFKGCIKDSFIQIHSYHLQYHELEINLKDGTVHNVYNNQSGRLWISTTPVKHERVMVSFHKSPRNLSKYWLKLVISIALCFQQCLDYNRYQFDDKIWKV